MTLYMIRHGEMAGDPFVRPTRPVSGSLSQLGLDQAEATRNAFADIDVRAVFSSPFGRALQTAEVVFGSHDIEIVVRDYLHEMMPNEHVRAMETAEWLETMKVHHERPADETWNSHIGENKLDMLARIVPPFLQDLESIGLHPRHGGFVIDQDATDGAAVFVAHGGSLGVVLDFLLTKHLSPVSSFTFEHTGVARIELVLRGGVAYPQLHLPAYHGIA